MRIANPIYDVMFKYLMDDNDLAKILLSTILDEEVLELSFTPQEHATKLEYPQTFTVYRLDFTATLKNAEGEHRKVLIELQKAKLPSDIMHFRRYLGEQYKNPNNVIQTDEHGKLALPLLTIYFLGHSLEYSKVPVIRVKRDCQDLATGERLADKEQFIESLTHDSYVIQIAHLGEHKRTALEELLQIFNQKWVVSTDKHILEIDEDVISEDYRPFLRRLQRAIAEKAVEEAMEIEDDMLSDLQDLERVIEKERFEKEQAQAQAAQAQVQVEQAQVQVEQAQAQVEQAQAQAEEAQTQVTQAQTQAEQAQAQAAQAQAENQRLLALLPQAGIKPVSNRHSPSQFSSAAL